MDSESKRLRDDGATLELTVLVYVMYAQEYPHLHGKQWLVIDIITYVEPREMSGYVFGEVIISYFSYMSRFGYKNVHLFADPPVQNEDYIFHIHPAFQVYKEADSLIRYYGSKFKDTQKPKKYETATDLIPFDGGLWTRIMKEIEDGPEEDQEEQHIKSTQEDYKHNFDRYIKAKIRTNTEDNFFLELAPHRSKIVLIYQK